MSRESYSHWVGAIAMLIGDLGFTLPKQCWRSVLCGENEALENEAAASREPVKVCRRGEGHNPQAAEGAPGPRCDIRICGVVGRRIAGRAANHRDCPCPCLPTMSREEAASTSCLVGGFGRRARR